MEKLTNEQANRAIAEPTPPLAEAPAELRDAIADYEKALGIVDSDQARQEDIVAFSSSSRRLALAASRYVPALLTAAEQGETLRAENERLRKMLEGMAQNCWRCNGTGELVDSAASKGFYHHPTKPCPSCAAARRALETP